MTLSVLAQLGFIRFPRLHLNLSPVSQRKRNIGSKYCVEIEALCGSFRTAEFKFHVHIVPQHAIAARWCWKFVLKYLIEINRVSSDPHVVLSASSWNTTCGRYRLILFRQSRQKGVQAPGFFKVSGNIIFLEHEDDLLPLPPTRLFIEGFGLNTMFQVRIVSKANNW